MLKLQIFSFIFSLSSFQVFNQFYAATNYPFWLINSINYSFEPCLLKGIFGSRSSVYQNTKDLVYISFAYHQVGFEFRYNFVLGTSNEYCCVVTSVRCTHGYNSFLILERVSKLEDIVLHLNRKRFSQGICWDTCEAVFSL